MPRPGLSRGARILRLCRKSSRIGAIHPWRRAGAWMLALPLLVVLLALYYLGKFGSWLSDLECWTEDFSHEWRDFVESKREMNIHRRAWLSSHPRIRQGAGGAK